jgi:hypothetical protein
VSADGNSSLPIDGPVVNTVAELEQGHSSLGQSGQDCPIQGRSPAQLRQQRCVEAEAAQWEKLSERAWHHVIPTRNKGNRNTSPSEAAGEIVVPGEGDNLDPMPLAPRGDRSVAGVGDARSAIGYCEAFPEMRDSGDREIGRQDRLSHG